MSVILRGKKTLLQRALAILRRPDITAHAYVAGANGAAVSGILTNNYTLSDGSTGYSAVDGSAGLVLDGMGSVGSELVTNGSGDTLTGWVYVGGSGGGGGIVSVAGQIVLTVATPLATLADRVAVTALTGLKIGSSYLATANLRCISGTAARISVTNGATDGDSTGNYVDHTTSVLTAKQFIFVATATTMYQRIISIGAAGNQAAGSAFSVKEVTGIHLTQATTANKPIVRRGMYNLLTYSNTLSDASWTKANVTLSTGQSDPYGGTAATKVIPTASTNSMYVRHSYAFAASRPYTVATIVEANGFNFAYLLAFDGAEKGCVFNLTDGTSTLNAGSAVATSVSLGGGYYLCVASFTTAAVPATNIVDVRVHSTNTLSSTMTGDGVSGINVYSTCLVAGTWTAAQILAEGGIPTTTATAASNPSAGKYWWSFDGSNDSLLSGNLGITTACTIVIAGRVNSLSAYQVLFAENTNGARIYVNTTGGIVFDNGTTGIGAAAVIAAGVPFVITVRLSSGTAVIRKNGAQIFTAASALTFSATTGSRIGTAFDGISLPTNGALGWVVPIAAALSDADCLTVERLVSSQFPNGPVF